MARPETGQEIIVASIGTFVKDDSGACSGTIKTLTLDIRGVQIRPLKKERDRTPDFQVLVGQTEIGVAWIKTSARDRQYLLVKLDDPSFPAPIYARLLEQDNRYTLMWSRSRDPD